MGLDVEAALRDKWLPWEGFHVRRRAGSDPALGVPPISWDSNVIGPGMAGS
ncbi:hypothetical protein GCM10027572_24500 [Flexivirga lutea]